MTDRHRTHSLSGVPCGPCHSGRCYNHWIESGLHTTELFRIRAIAATHPLLHELHIRSNEQIQAAYAPVVAAEKDGGACDMAVKLAYLATKYRNCHPSGQSLRFGWYDRPKYRLKIKVASVCLALFAWSLKSVLTALVLRLLRPRMQSQKSRAKARFFRT